MTPSSRAALENTVFLAALADGFGVDLRNCAPDYIERSLERLRRKRQPENLLITLDKLIQGDIQVNEIIDQLTIGTSEFFRDVDAYEFLQNTILPSLDTYPSIKIWSAGCSDGRELISLCVLLNDSGLLDKTVIYASDLSAQATKQARAAIFDKRDIQEFANRYAQLSGRRSSTDFYVHDVDKGIFKRDLLANVVFVDHDLLSQTRLDVFHLILCRNVLIYYQNEAQTSIVNLLTASLVERGFLMLGKPETICSDQVRDQYKLINNDFRVFQRR